MSWFHPLRRKRGQRTVPITTITCELLIHRYTFVLERMNRHLAISVPASASSTLSRLLCHSLCHRRVGAPQQTGRETGIFLSFWFRGGLWHFALHMVSWSMSEKAQKKGE